MKMTSDPNASRKAWLGLLAQSPTADVARHWASLGLTPDHIVLRSPEVGGVMVRGARWCCGSCLQLG